MDLRYRIMNVFTVENELFSGNTVAVFEDGTELTEDQQARLATQMSMETSFLLPGHQSGDVPEARFYSPEGKRGFAGSVTLATAATIADLRGRAGEVRLHEDAVGEISTSEHEGLWTLKAIPAATKRIKTDPMIVAAMIGLTASSIAGRPIRIESSRSGIIVPLHSPEDVRKAHVDSRMLHGYTMLMNSKPQVYVWAPVDERTVEARMFYGPRGGVLEVPATGSGVANLGWWYVKHGQLGIERTVRQGAAVGRHSQIELTVDQDAQVYVGGHCRQVGQGTINLGSR